MRRLSHISHGTNGQLRLPAVLCALKLRLPAVLCALKLRLPAVLCALALCAGLIPLAAPAPAAFTQAAYATPLDDARAALDEAEVSMAQISEEYDAIAAVVDDLQAQIDEAAAGALEAQEAYLEGRNELGRAAAYSYTSGSPLQLLTWLLDAQSLTELVRTMDYIDAVMGYQADIVEEQRGRKQRFDLMSQELNEKKNEQEEALARLEAKRQQAIDVVDAARDQVEGLEAEEAARLAQLEAAAAALEREQQREEAEVNPDADTVDREDVVGTATPVTPQPDPAPQPGDSASGWLTGTASAYGGSTDPYTPNPGTTATGAVCNDSSMGVAIPMSLPNYRSYLGRTVEIRYNGMTVYATVNDCGYMGGGSRALDLQPGVWKAFGFSSCTGWGVRTVSYRFL